MTSLVRHKTALHALTKNGRLLHGFALSGARCTRQSSCHHGSARLALYQPQTNSSQALRRQSNQPLVGSFSVRWLSHQSPCLWRLPTERACDKITSGTYRSLSTSSTAALRKTSQLADDRKRDDEKEERLSIFKRFKQMYRDYWYVLVPVHLATSTVWIGAFYYASKSGLDIAGMLQSWGFSESITDKLRNSSAGHIAVAYALYKLATPARYTVTLGGTTYSIKFLSERGYIKPVPSRRELKDMYDDRKEEFKERVEDTLEEIRKKRRKWREQFQERRKRGWRKR